MSGGTRVNQYFQSNTKRGGSAIKGGRFEINIHTPKMRMQNSADDQLIIHNLQNSPLQYRQYPSFKLKNPRLSIKYDQHRKQPNIIETYARKTRITVLESFYHQLGTDEDYSPYKNTQQTKLQPIILTPKSQTSYFCKQSKFIEDENIEEVHFHFVDMQQQCKLWLERFEKKNQNK